MKHARAIIVGVTLWVLSAVLLDFIIPDRTMNVIFILTVSTASIGVALVLYGTFTKNRWV